MNAMLQNARSRRVDTENRTDGQVKQIRFVREILDSFFVIFLHGMCSQYLLFVFNVFAFNIFSIFMHFVDFIKRFSRCAA